MGGSVEPKVGPTWIVVGDAAGSINPFNGEGIDYAYETGRMAAGLLDEALRDRRRHGAAALPADARRRVRPLLQGGPAVRPGHRPARAHAGAHPRRHAQPHRSWTGCCGSWPTCCATTSSARPRPSTAPSPSWPRSSPNPPPPDPTPRDLRLAHVLAYARASDARSCESRDRVGRMSPIAGAAASHLRDQRGGRRGLRQVRRRADPVRDRCRRSRRRSGRRLDRGGPHVHLAVVALGDEPPGLPLSGGAQRVPPARAEPPASCRPARSATPGRAC